ncbi:MAG: ABC transporter ATP-binding protein [Actinomycetota bacterium]|nr:ABC transporter ATP-binding protein [Actinomycetota bacterium]
MDFIRMKKTGYLAEDKPLLRDVDWRVRPGENWVVLGLNGSGKTTLIKLITGYALPSTGQMRILGRDFGGYDWRELRKEIGLASSALAEKFYAAETANEIVLSGLYATIGLYDTPEESAVEKAHAAMELMGIAALAERRYAELSQGEKQKVLIARAMVNSPKLLLLDEPCAGLDVFAREKVLSSIQRLSSSGGGPTMVMVSHHVEEIVPAFTHALLLRRGRVHSSGKTSDVLTEENLSLFFEVPVRAGKKSGRFYLEPR